MITRVTFFPNSINAYGFSSTGQPTVSGPNYTCSGGETTGPAYDLLDNRRSSVLTLGTVDETEAADILFQPSTAIPNCDFAIFDNHNFKTADAKIYILDMNPVEKIPVLASNSGALGSALSVDSVSSNVITPVANGMTLVRFNGARNLEPDGFRLNIDDVNTFDANVTLGEIVYGKSFTPASNPELGGIDGGGLYGGVETHETKAGIRSAVKQYGERKYWLFQFDYVSEADLGEFRRIWRETKGYPFYFSVNSDEATPPVYRARIMNDFEPEMIAYGAYSLSMEIEEEL